MNIFQIARVAYATIREYNREFGRQTPAWDELSEDMQEAYVRGVALLLARPQLTGEEVHNEWMRDRLATGWTYGPTRDDERRTHPNIVPYARLNRVEQQKDVLFAATVNALAPLLTR